MSALFARGALNGAGSREASKTPPATPSYDEDMTAEQIALIREFSAKFDLTGFVEEAAYED